MIHVLICEDDRVTRMLLKRILTRATPCEVTEVSNGAAALDVLRKKPFDLLLLDLMMPVMGGREALRLIRETPALQDLQVLILSGEHDEQEVRDVIGLGVLDFLLKPIGKEKTRNRLLAALETLKLQPRMRPTIPAVTERPTGAGQAV